MVSLITSMLMSCAGDSAFTQNADDTDTDITDAQEIEMPSTNRHSVPYTAFDAWYPTYWDLSSLSQASDLVFVGSVLDYREKEVVVPSADNPVEDPHRTSIVFDAIVFDVHELLTGSLPPEVEVKILTRALLLNEDGTPRFRISESPIEIVQPGIEAISFDSRPSYIVYVVEDPIWKHHQPGFYFFTTDGGVAAIGENEQIEIGAAPPLSRPLTSLGTVRTSHGLTLSDARGAADDGTPRQ